MHLANYTYKIVLKLLLRLGDPPITCEIERVHFKRFYFLYQTIYKMSRHLKFYNDFVLDILLNL